MGYMGWLAQWALRSFGVMPFTATMVVLFFGVIIILWRQNP